MYFWIFFVLFLCIMAGFAVIVGGIIHMMKKDREDREAQNLIFKSRHPYYRRRRDQ